MKFSDRWLREWIDPGMSPEELGHLLTMAGLELDSLESAAPDYSGIVVGEILEVKPHPDADKLRVCKVSDGSKEPLQVVCGAPNATAGMKVPFAQVGAVMPGFKIKKAKLRGVESYGMLCSAKEVGLAETSEGLMDLPVDAEVGRDFRDWMDLNDAVYDIDLTPNRADCLSIAGIAREAALLTERPLTEPAIEAIVPEIDDEQSISVSAKEDCPRYAGRIMRNVDAAAATPLWMQERLRRSGIRSINAVVDITNYVMLELGQPMHAFDLAKLSGAVQVRLAEQGESLTLLDGQEISLKADALIIADDNGPLALAGVMGGKDSGVETTAEDIFLECAFFEPSKIAGKARMYGLHTDSSHRFERGVDPELQVRAVERASHLIREICGGQVGPVTDISALKEDRSPVINFRLASIERLLGIALPAEEVQGILKRLGCTFEAAEQGWTVRPPSYRFDIAIEVDLVEEVARVYGYHRIEGESITQKMDIRQIDESQLPVSRLQHTLADLGYWEAITFSFVDAEIESLLSPGLKPVKLANPISSELSVMRTTLWSGLIRAVQHNLNRQQSRVRLFETGLSFVPGEGDAMTQDAKLAGIITGEINPESWSSAARSVDFYDLKGDVEMLLANGQQGEISFQALTDHPALHPGQSALIMLDGEKIGVMGALHPSLEQVLDIDQRLFMFELSLSRVSTVKVPKYAELSKYPAIRRDLALLVDEGVTAAQVVDAVTELAIPEIQDLYIFDVYTGEGVASGLKSIALGLILQDLSRTLNDKEVEEIIIKVVSRLENYIGASLRK
jgi:phenylalanyl-tRNA synthetase beta chain